MRGAGLLAALLLTSCSLGPATDDPDATGSVPEAGTTTGSPSADDSALPEPTGEPTAEPTGEPTGAAADPTPGPPAERACYRLGFDQALEPVTHVPARSCERPHTSRTYAVGRLGDLVPASAADGGVDSPAVQRAVAAECPRRLAAFLGGPEQAIRLSMFRPVWFTPSLAEADLGADWYRCDVIALASEESLAPLEGRLEGILGRSPAWKAAYGLCATAEPGAPDFERVACRSRHSWRALTTVPIEPAEGGRYPGVAVVRDLGTTPCTEAGRAAAEDKLDFRWGYEWPTLEQWRQGRRYGVCWAPAA